MPRITRCRRLCQVQRRMTPKGTAVWRSQTLHRLRPAQLWCFLMPPLMATPVVVEPPAWTSVHFSRLKSSLGCLDSKCICMDFGSGADCMQMLHLYLLWPIAPPCLSFNPAEPPPLLQVASFSFLASSAAVCFVGFALPPMFRRVHGAR